MLEPRLGEVLNLLMNDSQLPESLYDHPLTGDWKEFRDCHLMPDLVLIYRKQGEEFLELARIGSHSELGI